MGSLDSALYRATTAKGDVRQVGTDTPIAVRLKYIGTGTITSVTVTTATNIVMITSDGGTDTYAFATYDNIGKLVDAINADGIFKAKVLDSIRSEATATQFVNGAIAASTEDGVTFYDVKLDTDAADYFAVRFTFDRGFDKAHKDNHRVILQEIKYLMNVSTASANNLKVYEVDGTVETVRMQDLPVDNTATTINFASGEGKLTAGNGNDIVVKIDDGGNLADADGNYLRVSGLIE